MNSGPIPRSMRDCEAVRDLIVAEVEGCLEPAERELLDRHLPQCAKCRDEVARLKVLYKQMQSLGSQPAPLTRAQEQESWTRMRVWLGPEVTAAVPATIPTPHAERDDTAAQPYQHVAPSASPPACPTVLITPSHQPSATSASPPACLRCAPPATRMPYTAIGSVALAIVGLFMLGIGLHTMFATSQRPGVTGTLHQDSRPAPVTSDQGIIATPAPSDIRPAHPAAPVASDLPTDEIKLAIANWEHQEMNGTVSDYLDCYARSAQIYSDRRWYTWSQYLANKHGREGQGARVGHGSVRLKWKGEPGGPVRATFERWYQRGSMKRTGEQTLDFESVEGRWLIVRDEFHPY